MGGKEMCENRYLWILQPTGTLNTRITLEILFPKPTDIGAPLPVRGCPGGKVRFGGEPGFDCPVELLVGQANIQTTFKPVKAYLSSGRGQDIV